MDVGLGRDRKVIQRQVKISCYLDKHAYIIQIQLSFKIRPARETQSLTSKNSSQNPNSTSFFSIDKRMEENY